MIEPEHPGLPIVRQCELLGLARASTSASYTRPRWADSHMIPSHLRFKVYICGLLIEII